MDEFKDFLDDLKKFWNEGDFWHKIMVSAAALAIASLFMPWVDIGFATQNAFSQQTVILIAPVAYLFNKIVKGEAVSKQVSLILMAVALCGTVYYISSKNAELFGHTVNTAGSGAILFLLSTIAFSLGLYKVLSK